MRRHGFPRWQLTLSLVLRSFLLLSQLLSVLGRKVPQSEMPPGKAGGRLTVQSVSHRKPPHHEQAALEARAQAWGHLVLILCLAVFHCDPVKTPTTISCLILLISLTLSSLETNQVS